MIDFFLSNSYEPSYLDFQAIIKSDWNDYNIAIIELGTMYKIVEDKVPISPISYTLFTIDDITNLNYFKDYTIYNLPENTTEDEINDFTIFNKKDYLLYVRVYNKYTEKYQYKQICKYIPENNQQTFIFNKQEINELRKNIDKAFSIDIKLYGDLLYPIYKWKYKS